LILFIVQLLFFAIGILIAAILPKIKTVLPISMGTVLGFYVLGIFGDEKLRAFMPFKYFDPMYILKNNAYELNYLIVTLLIITISITLTYIIYKKKDIHSV
jgi:ABC-2 type transport system permease protein